MILTLNDCVKSWMAKSCELILPRKRKLQVAMVLPMQDLERRTREVSMGQKHINTGISWK